MLKRLYYPRLKIPKHAEKLQHEDVPKLANPQAYLVKYLQCILSIGTSMEFTAQRLSRHTHLSQTTPNSSKDISCKKKIPPTDGLGIAMIHDDPTISKNFLRIPSDAEVVSTWSLGTSPWACLQGSLIFGSLDDAFDGLAIL